MNAQNMHKWFGFETTVINAEVWQDYPENGLRLETKLFKFVSFCDGRGVFVYGVEKNEAISNQSKTIFRIFRLII